MISEDERDEDAIDPEDAEIEVEEDEEGEGDVESGDADGADSEATLGADAGAAGDAELGADGATGESEDDELDDTDVLGKEEPGADDLKEAEVAKYTITGLVDFTDDQGNITGQYPVGSEQVLPVEFGDKQVAEGRAEKVE